MLWENSPFQHVTVWWRWQGYRSDKCLIVGIDWEDTEADVPVGKGNLWEESWDDDDTSEDFSAQLRLLPLRPFTAYHPGLGLHVIYILERSSKRQMRINHNSISSLYETLEVGFGWSKSWTHICSIAHARIMEDMN